MPDVVDDYGLELVSSIGLWPKEVERHTCSILAASRRRNKGIPEAILPRKPAALRTRIDGECFEVDSGVVAVFLERALPPHAPDGRIRSSRVARYRRGVRLEVQRTGWICTLDGQILEILEILEGLILDERKTGEQAAHTRLQRKARIWRRAQRETNRD